MATSSQAHTVLLIYSCVVGPLIGCVASTPDFAPDDITQEQHHELSERNFPEPLTPAEEEARRQEEQAARQRAQNQANTQKSQEDFVRQGLINEVNP